MPSLESTLPQDVLDRLPDDFVIEVSNLSEDGQRQVIDAIANADGDVSGLNTDRILADAEISDAARETVENLHQEQADAVAAGDYAKADDLAHQAEFQLHVIEDKGGNADLQLATAESDEQHLDWAQSHQETAAQQAGWAADAAAGGDASGAETYAAMSAGHADIAAENATAADQGGHYGDHSFDSTASTGVETSAADTHVNDAQPADVSATAE
jgi:hypothetical protein